ncbi:GDYXXLXY domain-containing protein [Hoeflea ulvae]|uniref:GDYXXLXY domain-containing protein n=1 Tax=Hoeflea ulvae TaxID=2983764 RepID=A0ABT3YH14_9HYPH|nr:GDYXXLXY domain-containing protein [Hoeflea ulvae]MCY0095199.1 GDYXXLXY domain-containing protein [Hoeflea ulvae]
MTGLSQFLRRDINPVIAALVSAVVLIGMLGVMIQGRAAILQNGAEIILKAGPVDPRDLMRGDYVRLAYESISVADAALFEGEWPDKPGPVTVWLTLETDKNGLAVPTAITRDKPVPGNPAAVYLKSKPVQLYGERSAQNASVPLQFGIERYYVPEGEGLEIEAARNAGRTTVAVRVSKNGTAQIARLMIDGEALYQEPLY